MSEQTVSKPAKVTLCDLCGKEVDRSDGGSAIVRQPYNERPTVTPKEKWRWINIVVPRSAAHPYPREEQVDFHGKCISDLVRDTVFARRQAAADAEAVSQAQGT